MSGLLVGVVRKKIKKLHLRVYPPAGVRVSAPWHVSDEAVRLAVVNHLPWQRHQARLGGPRQPELKFVSGEIHYFKGRRYVLNEVVLHKGPARVVLRNETIDLYVREASDTSQRERVFRQWYRQQLKALASPLIEKWDASSARKWGGVTQMKTRWGTCNIKDRRVCLSLELIKKPLYCIDYVIVHEMVHLLERRHNDRFAALMDRFMPQWRLHRDELNQSATSR